MQIEPSLLKILKSVDTPTVFNAIEVFYGKRCFDNVTHNTMICPNPKLAPMVGFARTARIKASEASKDSPEIVKERRMAYYEYVADDNEPTIVVIEDTDWPLAAGAFWGEVNTYVHASLGLEGVITNGVVRDLGDLAPDFHILAGAVMPSHGNVHIVDYQQPVTVMGMQVEHNDFIHADQHGAVVIPQEVLPRLAECIDKLLKAEAVILEPVKNKKLTFKEFEKVWQAFENVRT